MDRRSILTALQLFHFLVLPYQINGDDNLTGPKLILEKVIVAGRNNNARILEDTTIHYPEEINDQILSLIEDSDRKKVGSNVNQDFDKTVIVDLRKLGDSSNFEQGSPVTEYEPRIRRRKKVKRRIVDLTRHAEVSSTSTPGAGFYEIPRILKLQVQEPGPTERQEKFVTETVARPKIYANLARSAAAKKRKSQVTENPQNSNSNFATARPAETTDSQNSNFGSTRSSMKRRKVKIKTTPAPHNLNSNVDSNSGRKRKKGSRKRAEYENASPIYPQETRSQNTNDNSSDQSTVSTQKEPKNFGLLAKYDIAPRPFSFPTQNYDHVIRESDSRASVKTVPDIFKTSFQPPGVKHMTVSRAEDNSNLGEVNTQKVALDLENAQFNLKSSDGGIINPTTVSESEGTRDPVLLSHAKFDSVRSPKMNLVKYVSYVKPFDRFRSEHNRPLDSAKDSVSTNSRGSTKPFDSSEAEESEFDEKLESVAKNRYESPNDDAVHAEYRIHGAQVQREEQYPDEDRHHEMQAEPSDHKSHQEESKKGDDHEFEEADGAEHEDDKHESHGEKGDKGYKNWHEEDKSDKGHKDKEHHEKEYDEKSGKKEDEEEEGGHYEEHDEGEKEEKKAEFGEEGEHKKGHSTKGHHSVHKKDEFEKKTEFYDEFHEDGESEKDGEFYEEHEEKHGGHHKSGHLDEKQHDEKHGSEKKYEKGGHSDEEKGHESSEGHDSKHSHEEKHGEKGEHEKGRKWMYKKGDGGGKQEDKKHR